ncbi:MAG TPA: hypothetical protein VK789_04300 [Bryobacteraceae bacterium]|nr:hypothetical protein [Bryobacteraceae bacterium]
MKHRFVVGLLFFAASTMPLLAQGGPAFDTSGNGLLKGTYYFRHIVYVISTGADSSGIAGDINEAVATYGNITFDGNGNYSIGNGTVSDSGVGQTDPLSCYIAQTVCTTGASVAGTYSISASGFGFISNPITGDKIWGLVSANNVFAGSSTETTSAFSDLFIAAFVPSPAPGNSFFQGTYTVAGFFPGGSPLTSEDAFFQLTPDGNGNLGTVTVGGYTGSGGTVTQSSPGVKYSFSNGAAVVTFPANQNAAFFLGGTANPEYFYFSPDGSFFFGGSPTGGYDMIVGVRNTSGAQNFSGLYYQAGLDQDDSELNSGFADFDGYFGSFNATGSGIILEHQRVSSIFQGAFGSTFADSFTSPITGNYTDTPAYEQYSFGGGGGVRIGQGIWPYMGISVALQAPSFSGSGVYLNPAGIVNAASFSPFTSGVSDGEMVTLFGSGLAPRTISAPANTFPLPTNLGGVQVLVNGTPAPLNYVSSGQILLNVPFATSLPCASVTVLSCFAQFQVMNGNGSSNLVTVPVNSTTPGVFTGDFGLGYGYAIDTTSGKIVTASTPVQPGDVIEAFVSGLGTVFPTVNDGAAAPSTQPLAQTTNTIAVDVGGIPATVGFAGLVPTLAGLYQVNFTVPSNATAGDNTLDISGPDSYATQALIPVGSASAGAARKPAAKARPQIRSGVTSARKPICLPGPGKTCRAQ